MSFTKEEEEGLFARKKKKKTLLKLNFQNINTSSKVKGIVFLTTLTLRDLQAIAGDLS